MNTVQVTVKYYNLVLEATKKRSETLSVPEGTTLRTLLLYLSERYGRQFREMILSEGDASAPSVSPHARIFLDGDAVSEGILDRSLEDGAEISIFMAISGGS
ncbi:MAG TPA: MoaD/ThiS family protein [Clostridia bacterium]|nr:MoaD/ThiS family protein [Clostridia bacterium]